MANTQEFNFNFQSYKHKYITASVTLRVENKKQETGI